MVRVKLGVVGCGAIAQVQHLPNLAGLTEEFEVTTVCDLSPGLAAWAAETFHVPASVTDYRRLVASDDVEVDNYKSARDGSRAFVRTTRSLWQE